MPKILGQNFIIILTFFVFTSYWILQSFLSKYGYFYFLFKIPIFDNVIFSKFFDVKFLIFFKNVNFSKFFDAKFFIFFKNVVFSKFFDINFFFF